jgi:hypothetical protein
MRLLSFLALPILLLSAAHAQITVSNHASGETIRYPVALLEGEAPGATWIESSNATHLNAERVRVPVEGGRFKVLAELRPGSNNILLESDRGRLPFALDYRPMTGTHMVRVVYVTSSDGDTRYESPLPNDPQNWREKLDTAAKLMQTFTAESMHRAGYGRNTFQLELDRQGRVVVHTMAYRMPGEVLRTRDGMTLYFNLHHPIGRMFSMDTNKMLAVMAFSRFNRETGQAEAHTALGGGGLGLFSNTMMWTWPSSLNDVHRAFTDTTPIDGKLIHDDSANRSVAWAAASTTIGAMLHEMGHTFGLPHTGDPLSIMTRGFDRFNRMFTLVEPPMRTRREPVNFKSDEIARWEPRVAAQLAVSRWFQPDRRPFSDANPPQIRVAAGELVIEAPNGIGAVIFMPSHKGIDNDDKYKSWFHEGFQANRPTRLVYRLDDLRAKPNAPERFRVLVADADGHVRELDEADVKQ